MRAWAGQQGLLRRHKDTTHTTPVQVQLTCKIDPVLSSNASTLCCADAEGHQSKRMCREVLLQMLTKTSTRHLLMAYVQVHHPVEAAASHRDTLRVQAVLWEDWEADTM